MKVKQQRRLKHIPQRTCVACRKKIDKRQLTRLVNTAEEGLIIDPSGKRNGRGTYLCDDPTCWDKAIKTRLLDQALRAEISRTEKERLKER
jgi:predicted RNA-binding protein YlxR (DUF448 family)